MATSAAPLLVIVYVSSAVPMLSRRSLARLLARSRAYNQAHDITGVLLYHDGCFMQALEGPPIAVEDLFDRIKRDPRHRGVIELCREPAGQREFPFWPMVLAPDFRALGLTWAGQARVGHDDFRAWREREGTASLLLKAFP